MRTSIFGLPGEIQGLVDPDAISQLEIGSYLPFVLDIAGQLPDGEIVPGPLIDSAPVPGIADISIQAAAGSIGKKIVYVCSAEYRKTITRQVKRIAEPELLIAGSYGQRMFGQDNIDVIRELQRILV